MSWNDENVEKLKTLWAEGNSASQIAGKLGSVTRNAVIGKVHRLGLGGRATRVRLHKPRGQAKSKYFAKSGQIRSRLLRMPEKPLAPAPKMDGYQQGPGIAFDDLEAKHCRFPITGEETRKHRYCGKGKVKGLPYCEHHARIAFQPTPARRPDAYVERRQFRAFA